MYYGARYYDAALGRFLQPDSIVPDPGNPQSLNRYTYGNNNPLRYTDPKGRCGPCVFVVGLSIALAAWLANPAPVAAPVDVQTLPPVTQDPGYGDKVFLDSAPGTGDVSDIYALGTGHRLFTGESQDRTEAAAFALLPGITGGIKYLRHADPGAFERLLRAGKREAPVIKEILQDAGSSTVIRGMVDQQGRQVLLTAGNRDMGLRHVLGRHLTGEIPGDETTFFSGHLKVGDIVDLISNTIRQGTSRVGSDGERVYEWLDETEGWIRVITNDSGEVTSAYPF